MTDSAKEELVLQGIAASPGVVHGQAFVYLQNELDVPCYTVASTDLDSEVERFEQAILATRGQITEVRNTSRASRMV